MDGLCGCGRSSAGCRPEPGRARLPVALTGVGLRAGSGHHQVGWVTRP